MHYRECSSYLQVHHSWADCCYSPLSFLLWSGISVIRICNLVIEMLGFTFVMLRSKSFSWVLDPNFPPPHIWQSGWCLRYCCIYRMECKMFVFLLASFLCKAYCRVAFGVTSLINIWSCSICFLSLHSFLWFYESLVAMASVIHCH